MSKKSNLYWLLALMLAFSLVLTACGGKEPSKPVDTDAVGKTAVADFQTQQAAASPTPDCPPFDSQTGWPLSSVSNGGCNYAPAGQPTDTSAAATATNASAASTCSGAVLDKHEDMGTASNPIYNDTTAGDIRMNAVAYSWNGTDPTTKVVTVVPAGVNVDIERPGVIAGYVEYYVGTFEGTTCFANAVATANNAYRFYAGFGNIPNGFSTTPPNGWIMTVKAWPFATKIEVPGAIWTDGILDSKGAPTVVRTGPNEWSKIQWWDGSDSDHARHIVLGPNTCVQNDGSLQGKHWNVTGFFDLNLLLARFVQMSEERVILDEIASPYRTWLIGGSMPEGWSSALPPNVKFCP